MNSTEYRNSTNDSVALAGRAVRTAAQHGLGGCIRELRLDWHLPLVQRWHAWSRSEHKVYHHAQRLAHTAQSLGGVFTGFAQYAGRRADLLGFDTARSFAALNSRIEPLHPNETRAIIEKATGPIEKVFSYLSKLPSKQTWNSQIHTGRLKNGTPIKLTVRPKITTDTEFEALRYLACKAQTKVPRALDLVDGFESDVLQKQDLARYAREVHAAVKSAKGVQVAPVHWNLSNSSVIVEDDLSMWKVPGFASSVLIENALSRGMLLQGSKSSTPSGAVLIEDAHFHVMDRTERKQCKNLWHAVLRRDPGRVTSDLLKAGTATEHTNIPFLHASVSKAMQQQPLAALQAILDASFTARLSLPESVHTFAQVVRSE